MKLNNPLIVLLLLFTITGCGGGGGSTPKTLVSIAVTPANSSIALNTSQKFSATGTFSDSTTQDLTTSVNWTSLDTSIATIDAAGRATGVAAGTTTIKASSGGVFGVATLTVTSATLVSLAILPADPSIALGTSQQFKATGTFSDSTTQDVTELVTWSSSATSVATIGNAAGSNGKATAAAAGVTTISAVRGTIPASTTLTVTPATLVSITVTPADPSVPLGTPQQFSVTGTFSDSTTQDLTTSATWSSSATSVATISNSGMATPVAAGATTITASVPVTQPIPGSISDSTTLTVTAVNSNPVNVMSITVNGSLCSSGSYSNKPCVSVTVCTPNTSNCQVVNDILLDTGSYGLRIFKQALGTLPLPQVTVASGVLVECVQFGDGSSEWGPVQMASVTLGGEPAVQVPMQVVDATFATRSSGCQNADTSPAGPGFNGILGVGVLAQDCGANCASSVNNRNYYACSGSTCSGTKVPLASQVTNPVALLPQDNNGVLVQLPSVPLGGVPSVNGALVLGIGTRSNNSPAAATAYPADSFADFTTTFNGATLSSSFIDSGSNGLYFPGPASLPDCPSPNSGFFCPAATTSLFAVNTGAFGTPSGTVQYQIGNFVTLANTSNNVFSEVGGSNSEFDWGLPFFFGKNVFIGIEGKRSALGTGPYWAY